MKIEDLKAGDVIKGLPMLGDAVVLKVQDVREVLCGRDAGMKFRYVDMRPAWMKAGYVGRVIDQRDLDEAVVVPAAAPEAA